MKRVAVVLALSVAVWAQLPDNELLRAGQPETVLAGQPGPLDWAEARARKNCCGPISSRAGSHGCGRPPPWP